MVAARRSKSLTTGNVRCGVAAVHDTGELSLDPSLWRIRWGTSSQCSSEWSRCVKPRSYFPALLTTRAEAFSKRCNLSLMVLGDPANTVLPPSIRVTHSLRHVIPSVTHKLRTVHEMRDTQCHACALNNFVVISRDTL